MRIFFIIYFFLISLLTLYCFCRQNAENVLFYFFKTNTITGEENLFPNNFFGYLKILVTVFNEQVFKVVGNG